MGPSGDNTGETAKRGAVLLVHKAASIVASAPLVPPKVRLVAAIVAAATSESGPSIDLADVDPASLPGPPGGPGGVAKGPGGKPGTGNPGHGRRQERLRQIGNDPKASRSDRGWIKQEENSIARGKRSSIRVPPGKELGHTRGREAAKGYDHVDSPSHLKPQQEHRAQHKIDGYGRKNPQQGPPPPKKD